MTATPLIDIPPVHPPVLLGQASCLCAAPRMWEPCAVDEINFRLACPVAGLNLFPGALDDHAGGRKSCPLQSSVAL